MLEPAKGAFPKRPFVYVVQIRIKENKCELASAGKSFSLDLSDETTRAAVYDAMIDALKNELKRAPWDAVEKQPIGFLWDAKRD